MLKQYIDFDAKRPFKTFITDPEYNGRFNGVIVAIMQSDENKEKVLKRAKENTYWLTSREDALEEALEYYNLTESDFTDIDYNYLIQWARGVRN